VKLEKKEASGYSNSLKILS